MGLPSSCGMNSMPEAVTGADQAGYAHQLTVRTCF
jgi:hypothetical protein